MKEEHKPLNQLFICFPYLAWPLRLCLQLPPPFPALSSPTWAFCAPSPIPSTGLPAWAACAPGAAPWGGSAPRCRGLWSVGSIPPPLCETPALGETRDGGETGAGGREREDGVICRLWLPRRFHCAPDASSGPPAPHRGARPNPVPPGKGSAPARSPSVRTRRSSCPPLPRGCGSNGASGLRPPATSRRPPGEGVSGASPSSLTARHRGRRPRVTRALQAVI